MPDAERDKRFDDLDVRIQALKKESGTTQKINDHHSMAHLAWRMVIELVVGITIGFVIGYGIDFLCGTIPIFMVTFIFLGFAAGVSTMLRSAKELQDQKSTEAVIHKEG